MGHRQSAKLGRRVEVEQRVEEEEGVREVKRCWKWKRRLRRLGIRGKGIGEGGDGGHGGGGKNGRRRWRR